MWNTFYINVYGLLAGFPVPIILALALHYCPALGYKKTVQMVTYAPHFISTVVMVGIINKVLQARIGLVNVVLALIGIPHRQPRSPRRRQRARPARASATPARTACSMPSTTRCSRLPS